jgi:hypothetical protein
MLQLDPLVTELLGDPMLLQAVLLADSMGWPSSYRDLQDMPYRLYMMTCAVRSARDEDRPPPATP